MAARSHDAARRNGADAPAGGGPRSRRGVAVMMVVLILAALMSIAGPFAISMHLYERNARHFRDTVRARLAAEGGVARAISCLRRTEDAAELEGRYGAPWNDPDVDTQAELDVFFDFAGKLGPGLKQAGFSFSDPEGLIWSVDVEDEQGKINLLSAPPRAFGSLLRSANLATDLAPGANFILLDDAGLFEPTSDGDPRTPDGRVCIGREIISYTHVNGDRLEGLTRNAGGWQGVGTYKAGTLVYDAAAEDVANAAIGGHFKTLFELKGYLSPRDFERIQPYVTVNSYRDASEGWLTRVAIEGNFGSSSRGFRVRSVAGFAAGARARITELYDGVESVRMNRILWARQRGQWGNFELYQPIGFERRPTSVVHVQAEQFHPVNVNTAQPKVLEALFTGLGRGRQRVSGYEAERIADYVYDYVRPHLGSVRNGRPLGSHADFRAMLEACRRSGWLENGLSRDKIDAIAQDATATMCFKAFGNFTIEAAGVVNTPAGEESARYVIRELVTMPVHSSTGEWSISSQKDFDEQNSRLIGRKVETWPFTEPPTKGSGLDVYKRGFVGRTDRTGYVTLAAGRAGGSAEHFDARSGRFLGPYTIDHGAAVLKGGSMRARGAVVFEKSNDLVKPFTFEGWFRRDGGMAPGLAAGTGKRNSFRLAYYTAGQSGTPEYLLEVADACAGQGLANRPWCGPAEFRFEAPRLDPGDWYHVAMQVKGTSPGEALVWVDGVVSRGSQSSYRPGTRLAQSLPLVVPEVGTEDALLTEGVSVSVDDTNDFPPRGAVLVDGEVMEYWKNPGGAFDECRRARRYTHLAAHPMGAVVTPYGYSVALESRAYPGSGTVSAVKGVGAIGPGPLPWIGPQTTIEEKPLDEPAGVYDLLPEGATEITVDDTDDFQESGYLCMSGGTRQAGEPYPVFDPVANEWTNGAENRTEFVFYASKDGDKFTGCERLAFPGADRTKEMPGREFMLNGAVVLRQMSIAVTGDLGQFYAEHTDDGGLGPTSGSDCYACLITTPDDPDLMLVECIKIGRKETRGGITYLLGWGHDTKNTKDTSDDTWGPYETWGGWRGQFDTVYRRPPPPVPTMPFPEVPVGTRIVPAFRVKGPQCGDFDSPRGCDYVTLVEGERAEDQPSLIAFAHAKEDTWTDLQGRIHHTFTYRVAFNDTIAAGYPENTGRILKFPSGEFLRKIPDALTVGGSNGGGFVGAIDELRTDKGGTPSAVVTNTFDDVDEPPPNQPLGLGSGELAITLMAELATDGGKGPKRDTSVESPAALGGVVRIGDELIWYRSRSGPTDWFVPWGKQQRTEDKWCPQYKYTEEAPNDKPLMKAIILQNCVRGILGTGRLQSDHAFGARATFFEGIPLTVLTDPLPPGADYLRIRDGPTFPAEGYAIITSPDQDQRAAPGRGEIVGWTSGGPTSFEGCEFFRGRYGTPERAPLSGDFCQLLPFRYWDRYALDFDDETELAYFQCSYAARDARWESIEWSESGYTGGAATDRVRLRLVCRFDGEPEWNEKPTNGQGGLWEFRGDGKRSFRSAGGGPLIADSIEVRVYYEFLGRAWDVDEKDWKRNVRLDNLAVRFGNPLVVRKVDLLDY